MSRLQLTQLSFEGGEQKDLYYWKGAFPFKCSQAILPISAEKYYGLASDRAANWRTYEKRQAEEESLYSPAVHSDSWKLVIKEVQQMPPTKEKMH